MTNPANNVTLTGRLAADPISFANSDGSHKVVFTLMVEDDFVKKSTGKRDVQAIDLEAFVSKERVATGNGLGVYDLIHKGDLITVSASLRSNNYTDKNGTKVYKMTVFIDGVRMLESKATTESRKVRADAMAAALNTSDVAEAVEETVVVDETVEALRAQLAAAEAAAKAQDTPFES